MQTRWKAFLLRLLALSVLALVLLAAVYCRMPCLFRRLTGIPCPCCGMSRAWLAALRLELQTAFTYHPMFWSLPVLALVFLLDGFPIPGHRVSRWLYTGILVLLIGCYFLRLYLFLNGLEPF